MDPLGRLRVAATQRLLLGTQGIAASTGPLRTTASRLLAARGYRPLAPTVDGAEGTPTSARLNAMLTRIGGTRYLEVGLWTGRTFEAVDAEYRVGVDPFCAFNRTPPPIGASIHPITSDLYFRRHPDETFDLIFLDGLHEFRQTYRDLVNATRVLAPGGAIVIDDVVPSSPAAAARTFEEANRLRRPEDGDPGAWMGDVFRVVLVLIDHHPELEVLTVVDADHRPQTVVRRNSDAPTRSVPEELLVQAEETTFLDVFGAGIPDGFRPMPLAAALEVLGR